MRLIVTTAAFTLLASYSALACCGTCEGEHDHAHGEAHAHAAAAAAERGDAKASASAYETVELEAQRFVIFKGTLGDPKAAWVVAHVDASSQDLITDQTHAWSIMPTMPDTNPPAPETEYWAGFTIADAASVAGPLEAYTTPGGKYMRAVHIGPYENLGSTWEGFAMSVVGGGMHDDSRPLLEHYVSDPMTTPAEELVTHLYIPVK